MSESWGQTPKMTKKEEMPVQKYETPAPVINLNKKIYEIEIMYLDYILEGFHKTLRLTKQDPVFESKTALLCGGRAGVSEEMLRVATLLIVELIELKNCF